MTTNIPDFANQLQQLTYQLTRYYEVCDRYCTDQIGIPAAQAYTLLAIPQNEAITMNALSEKMGVANNTMTHTIDLLVKKKLVERENDPQDRRVVRVRLTPPGFEMQAALDQTLQGFFEQAAQAIPAGERSEVIARFQQVNSAILKAIQACCSPF